MAVALALLLGACSFTGGGEQADPYQASIGSNERTEITDALGFSLVVDGEGNGRIVGTLIKSTEETQGLVGAVVTTDRGPDTAVVGGDRLDLPSDEPVELAREPAVGEGDQQRAPVPGDPAEIELEPDQQIELTLS